MRILLATKDAVGENWMPLPEVYVPTAVAEGPTILLSHEEKREAS